MPYNSDNFNLRNWKITLPVDKNGSFRGEALELTDLNNFESSYFYDAPDGAMVFSAYADGATTSGSEFSRSELREMNNGRPASWTASQGGTMTATLKVDQVPHLSNGQLGRVIVGQIHGKNEELVRLYWDKGSMYFMNDHAGPKNKELRFSLTDASGNSPSINLGEKFSYKIDAHGNTLKLEIHADGKIYTSTSSINTIWQGDKFYFKAGIYLGVNEDSGNGVGKVSFYGLDYGHSIGSGLNGLKSSILPPHSDPEIPHHDASNFNGTSNDDSIISNSLNNVIHAYGGHDIVRSGDGADTVYGEEGNDKLYGGSGSDTLYGGSGDDFLSGDTGSDIAIGGLGHDTFFFTKGDGDLVIKDFFIDEINDYLLVKGFTELELKSSQFIQDGNDTILRFNDGTRVVFDNVQVNDMHGAELHADIDGTIRDFTPGKGIIFADPDNSSNQDTPGSRYMATNGNDVLKGDDRHNDVIVGLAGNDVIDGNDGNDTLDGGDGQDKLFGNDDNDHLIGGAGNDFLYGDDDNDNLEGGSGSDMLYGGSGNDTLTAGDGRDTLYGGEGRDVLHGGPGADRLYGGDGDDVLISGMGTQKFYGGEGEDVFVFSVIPHVADVISDFDLNEDKIDISGLIGSRGVITAESVSDNTTGLYVDPDGLGSARTMLITLIEDKLDISDIKEILV